MKKTTFVGIVKQVKNKPQAIKVVVFLMTKWNISGQDFIDEFNKRKREEGK